MKINYENTPPIGIDLGTTNSLIAKYIKQRDNNGKIEVYNHNKFGKGKQFPSLVFAEKYTTFRLFAGKIAYDRRFSHPNQVAASIKRKIGSNKLVFNLLGKKYTPRELWKIVARDIFKDPREVALNLKPNNIVVTVPYDFGEIEKSNTIKSVESALKEIYPDNTPVLLKLLPEPVAAGLFVIYDAFSFGNIIDSQNLIVIDWGGGTIDITLINYHISNREILFEVLATDGKLNLGGDDIDFALENLILEKTEFSYDSVDINIKKRVKSDILKQANTAKENISITYPYSSVVFQVPDYPVYKCKIEIDDLRNILHGQNSSNRNFFKEIENVIVNVLSKASKNKTDINALLFIGGSSKILGFRDFVKSIFNDNIVVVNELSEKDDYELIFESVVKGAAIYCALEEDKQFGTNHKPFGDDINNVKIITRSSHAIAVKLYKNNELDIIVKENQILPVQIKKVYNPVPANSLNHKINLLPLTIIEIKGEQKNIIGTIPFPEFFRHGRALEDINILVNFTCNTSNIDVDVVIENSDENQKDIKISKAIKYQI